MIHNNADGVTEKLLESLLMNRYHIGLETSMRDCDFISGCVHLLKMLS